MLFLIRHLLIAAIAAITLGTVPLVGQCQLEWQPGNPVSGVSGKVHSMVPAPGVAAVYAFGEFEVAGGVFANNAACWDGVAWSALGAGTNGVIRDAVQMPNGDLVVGGEFSMAGGQAAARVARWNGSSWSPLAQGFNGEVFELLVMSNGDLLAAGTFTQSGQTTISRLARWNGTSWSQFAASVGTSEIYTMEQMPNGDVVIGGALNLLGSSLPLLAVWNGASWSLPTTFGGVVRDTQLLPNGDLVLVGTLPGLNRFATWDGASVQLEQLPLALDPQEMCVDATGEVYVVGDNLLGGANVGPTIARRSNGSWLHEFDGPTYGLLSVVISNGHVFAGGTGIEQTSSVFWFDGTSWTPVGAQANTPVFCLAGGANRTLYAGGSFDAIGSVPANNVARFDGSSWHAMGQGVDGAVYQAEVTANGEVVVAGLFANAGGAPAPGIARWNGVSWSTLGGISMPNLRDLACGGDGEIAAVSSSNLFVFDGVAWTSVPLPGGTSGFSSVAAVQFLPNGDVVIAGSLNGANVQVWNGLTWSERGLTNETALVSDLLVSATGELYRAASDNFLHAVARWDGIAWQQLGASFQFETRLESLPTGELVIQGDLDPVANGVAIWNGSSWQTIDGGVTGATSPGGPDAMAVTGAGELWVSGGIVAAGAQVSASYARAVSSCPATATIVGAGCVGSNGSMSLVPRSNPWLGTTMRARATGFTAQSFGLHVLGTNPTVAPLPLGSPGCWQLVDPVLFELLTPVLGEATASFAVPNLSTLIGQSFRTQVVGIELGAMSALTGVTSTNALDATIGSY